jgi:hypothetical protein
MEIDMDNKGKMSAERLLQKLLERKQTEAAFDKKINIDRKRNTQINKIRSAGLYWHLCHYELLFKKLFAGMTIKEAADEAGVSASMIHSRLRSVHRLVVYYVRYYPENADKIFSLMEGN